MPFNLQADGQAAAVMESRSTEAKTGDAEDHTMGSEEDDGGPAKAKTSNSKQNEKLYAEEGMLNTKLRKAEKKKKKKNKSGSTEGNNMDDDDDYNFKVDYVKEDTVMEEEEEDHIGKKDGEADEMNQNRFQLPSGVDLENES